jgi:hypothetical protein
MRIVRRPGVARWAYLVGMTVTHQAIVALQRDASPSLAVPLLNRR